jgi:2,4-dienoyl-CoA reductase (NADPH2)
MSTRAEADHHRVVTQAVHDEDGKICMQILHTGKSVHSLARST